MDEKEFYTIPELCGPLGYPASTLYYYAKIGVIPAVRINGSVRVPARALREWIAQKEREASVLGGDVPGSMSSK